MNNDDDGKREDHQRITLSLVQLAVMIDREIERIAGDDSGLCFSLLVYEPVQGSQMHYVSNADPEAASAAMQAVMGDWGSMAVVEAAPSGQTVH